MNFFDQQLPLLPALARNLIEQPDKTGIQCNHIHYSYQQINNRILVYAAALEKFAVTRASCIGVMLSRRAEIVPVILSIWFKGAIYIPLDTEWPISRLKQLVEQSNITVLLGDISFSNKLDCLPCAKLYLDSTGKFQNCNAAEHITDSYQSSLAGKVKTLCAQQDDTDKNRLLYIMHTSGTTGAPVAISISVGNLETLLRGIQLELQLPAGSIFSAIARFCFDISIFELIMPFMVCGQVNLVDESKCNDPHLLTHHLATNQLDVIMATPSLWNTIINFMPDFKKSQSLGISTGDLLSEEIAKLLRNRLRDAWNLYGPTECTIWSTAKKINHAATIGSPLTGYNCCIVNKQGESVKTPGIKGELCISGTGVSAQVCKNEGFFRTGDICYWNEDHELVFCGRKDNQIKLNGFRMEAEEIEYFLELHETVEQCIVCKESRTGKPTNKIHPALLVAYVYFKPGKPNKDARALNRHLSEYLPAYMHPQSYRVLEHPCLDANGKKSRNTLSGSIAPGVSVHAGNEHKELYKKVAALVAGLLEIEKVGYLDSFFDIGGNSMLCASLLLAINNQFGTNFRLGELIDSPPTVLKISRMIETANSLNSPVQS